MSAPLECTDPAAVLAAIREDAKLPPITRLMVAAKRLDDFVNCRLGVVVPDEVRVAIYAEHSAAVEACRPFFAPMIGGFCHGDAQSAPAGEEGKAA